MSNPFSKKRKINNVDNSIHRELLDFDFEKVCSVTLSPNNVYCCLVCGKYFQGKAKSSPAYNHSISVNHHIYLNLTSEIFYQLPDDVEIPKTHELQDIIEYLNPTYTQRDIDLLPRISFDLNSDKYLVGYVGLNNIKQNDYANVIVQALAHIEPIRNHYLLTKNHPQSPLNETLGNLIKKMWSPHLFKSHIAPHEFLNCVARTSKNKFTLEKGSPKPFLLWLLNKLNEKSFDCLRGKIEMTSTPIVAHEGNDKVEFITLESKTKTVEQKFWMLSVEVPSQSFATKSEKIQEVLLEDLLLKYDGETKTQGEKDIKTYRLVELPEYLILTKQSKI
ncbi:hypothetical protein G210_4974 [Candida maltosa Xu316]|uniref:Uncharacterized protein n=1 Tax=Candida maltosa (strain Xu316) TaxID=1245528 RepID=M3ITT4_CANMX|nr:hypothetical protein G210_4974 [Candida maltosa Xu316]